MILCPSSEYNLRLFTCQLFCSPFFSCLCCNEMIITLFPNNLVNLFVLLILEKRFVGKLFILKLNYHNASLRQLESL